MSFSNTLRGNYAGSSARQSGTAVLTPLPRQSMPRGRFFLRGL